MHDLLNETTAQFYQFLTTHCESFANKRHMEEQNSVFNLKLPNYFSFR